MKTLTDRLPEGAIDPESCGKRFNGECDKVCDRERELKCSDYKPLSVYQQPIRKGCLAMHYFEVMGDK